jgi:hypothetical protein
MVVDKGLGCMFAQIMDGNDVDEMVFLWMD